MDHILNQTPIFECPDPDHVPSEQNHRGAIGPIHSLTISFCLFFPLKCCFQTGVWGKFCTLKLSKLWRHYLCYLYSQGYFQKGGSKACILNATLYYACDDLDLFHSPLLSSIVFYKWVLTGAGWHELWRPWLPSYLCFTSCTLPSFILTKYEPDNQIWPALDWI